VLFYYYLLLLMLTNLASKCFEFFFSELMDANEGFFQSFLDKSTYNFIQSQMLSRNSLSSHFVILKKGFERVLHHSKWL